MKSGDSSKIFPTNAQHWEAVIAQAPGIDRPLTAEERAKWDGAVLVNGGGYLAARGLLLPSVRMDSVACNVHLSSIWSVCAIARKCSHTSSPREPTGRHAWTTHSSSGLPLKQASLNIHRENPDCSSQGRNKREIGNKLRFPQKD